MHCHNDFFIHMFILFSVFFCNIELLQFIYKNNLILRRKNKRTDTESKMSAFISQGTTCQLKLMMAKIIL